MALETCYGCNRKFHLSELTRRTKSKKTGEIGKQVGLYHNLKTKQKTVKVESRRNIYTDIEVFYCKNCKPINLLYFIFIGWWVWIYVGIFKITVKIFKIALLLPFTLIKNIVLLPFKLKKNIKNKKK